MSKMISVFIGPCAEWLVPRGQAPGFVHEHPIMEELVDSLRFVASEGELPVVADEGGEYVLFAFYPNERRDGAPDREMHLAAYEWHAAAGEEVWRVDRRAELRWFAKAYKPELDRLAAHFGAQPKLSWRLHAWMQ